MRIQFSCSLPDLLEERPALKNESFPRGMMHCLHHFMCFAQKSIGFLEFLLRIPLSPTMVFSLTLQMAHVFTAVCLYPNHGALRTTESTRDGPSVPHWKENPPFSEAKDGKVQHPHSLSRLHPPASGSWDLSESKTNPAPKREAYVHTSRLGALRHDHQVSYLFLLE